MDTISTAQFDYRNFPPAERLAEWRQMIASLYETSARGDPEAFTADAIAYRIGELVFNQVAFSAARFRRESRHLQGESKDFLTLQVQLTDDERLIMPHGQVRLLTGHIYLRDWAYEFDSEASAMRLNSIIIPRHRLRVGSAMHEHNPVLSWSAAEPGGRLLSMLWTQLLVELPDSTLAEARNLCDAFLGFLDALLGFAEGGVTPVTLEAMQQFLRVRLQGDIGVADLCRHFGVSRSTVYRLFEPLGGVRQTITRARLERCYAELRLADPDRIKVADVAACWGFTEASSFTRRFRSQFSVPPTHVLGSGYIESEESILKHGVCGESFYGDYMHWLQQASGYTERK